MRNKHKQPPFHQTTSYKKIKPFFTSAMEEMGMEREADLLRAMGLVQSAPDGWKKTGRVRLCYPLAVKGLLAERGFTVGSDYEISRGHKPLAPQSDGYGPLTREQLELAIRGLVSILVDGKLSEGSVSIAAALVNSMLDELWEVNPLTKERAPVGAPNDISGSKTLSEAIEGHARKAEALGD